MSAEAFAPARQMGVVLFVAMVVLLVMSLLAMIAANAAIDENKMASSERNRELAQLTAASALDEGRLTLQAVAAAFGPSQVCAHLRCATRDSVAPADATNFLQTAAAKASANALHLDLSKLAGSDATARVAVNGYYVVEDLGIGTIGIGTGQRDAHFFRISAGASGGTSQFIAALEVVCTLAP